MFASDFTNRLIARQFKCKLRFPAFDNGTKTVMVFDIVWHKEESFYVRVLDTGIQAR